MSTKRRRMAVPLKSVFLGLCVLSMGLGTLPGCKGSSPQKKDAQKPALSITEYWQSLLQKDPEGQKEFERIQDEFRRGEHASALRDLQELLKRSPEAPWAEAAEFYLAQAWTLLRRYGDAIRQLDLLLERYPDSPAVPRFLISKGQIYLTMGKQAEFSSTREDAGDQLVERAREIFQQVSKDYRDNTEVGPEALFYLAEVFSSLEEKGRAREAFRKVAEAYPATPWAGKSLYALANLHLSEADPEGAERVFQEIAERYPDTRLADKARKKLEGIRLVGSQAPPLQVEQWIGDPPPEAGGYRSRVTLLSFWSIWCPHCKRNIPKMERLLETYGKEGVSVVGVTRVGEGQGVEKVREYVDSHPMGFPTAVDDDGKTSKEMAVTSIPCVVAVDSQHRIRWHGHPDQLSDKVIKSLLQTSS